MKSVHYVLIACLAFTLSVQCDPGSAAKIVERYQKNIAGSTGMSYQFTHQGTGPLAQMFPLTQGVVKVVPSKSRSGVFDRTRISAVSGEGESSQRIEVAMADDVVFSLDAANQRLLRAPVWRSGVDLVNFQYLFPLALVQELAPLKPADIHYRGEERVGDTLCVVVEVATQMADLTLYFGKQDALLYRGVARKPQAWGDGTIEMSLRDFEIDEKFPDDDFHLTAPKGYAAVEYSGRFPTLGKRAPDFTLSGFDGTTASLDGLEGKVVVLDFWATWCGPCKKSMPGLQRLHERYAAKGLAIIGVNYDEKGDPKAFLEKHNFTYRFASSDGSDIAEHYKPNLPMAVVIDRHGRLVEVFSGYFGEESDARLEKLIKQLL